MTTREFSSIGEFAKFFREAASEARIMGARNLALETAASWIEAEAKHVIGTYEFDWPQLAPSTQAERTRKGLPANEPLLRTGEMRDSISHEITIPGEEAIVGSESDIALYQELGTDKVPPRPFLMPSVFYLKKPIEQMIGVVVGSAVAGASIEREILRLLLDSARRAGRTAKDIFNDQTETPERE